MLIHFLFSGNNKFYMNIISQVLSFRNCIWCQQMTWPYFGVQDNQLNALISHRILIYKIYLLTNYKSIIDSDHFNILLEEIFPYYPQRASLGYLLLITLLLLEEVSKTAQKHWWGEKHSLSLSEHLISNYCIPGTMMGPEKKKKRRYSPSPLGQKAII